MRAVPLSVDRLWSESDALSRVLAELDCPYEGRRTISLHDRFRIDELGAEAHCRMISVVEATQDRVDRMLAIYRDDEAGHRRLPTIVPVSGVRPGRIRCDAEAAFTVAELHFDDVLYRGERTIVEYELRFHPGGVRTSVCDRRFAHPVRQYLLEIDFAAHARPARGYAVYAPAVGPRSVEELRLPSGGTARHVFLDVPAGSYGIEWEWPDPTSIS